MSASLVGSEMCIRDRPPHPCIKFARLCLRLNRNSNNTSNTRPSAPALLGSKNRLPPESFEHATQTTDPTPGSL
eukprot:14867012-Alexandrium_andersonii.AAC.1